MGSKYLLKKNRLKELTFGKGPATSGEACGAGGFGTSAWRPKKNPENNEKKNSESVTEFYLCHQMAVDQPVAGLNLDPIDDVIEVVEQHQIGPPLTRVAHSFGRHLVHGIEF